MQHDDVELRIARAGHGRELLHELRQLLLRQIPARHMAQRVDQHEPVLRPGLRQRREQWPDERPGLLSSQAAKRLWQMVLSELEMRSACLLEIL